MLKHNTLLIVLFGSFLLSALLFSKSTSPYAFAASKSLSAHGTLVPLGLMQKPIPALSPSNGGATVASPPATKVVFFSPSGIRGTLDEPVDCWETSLAAPRVNAWRCVVAKTGSRLYDPCFSTSARADYVICDADPAGDTRGLKAMLAHPLPAPTYYNGFQAWMVRLSDGSVCGVYTGATSAIGGERVNYGCTNGLGVVGNPRIEPVWTVRLGKWGQSPQAQLVTMSILEVWW